MLVALSGSYMDVSGTSEGLLTTDDDFLDQLSKKYSVLKQESRIL